MQEKEVQKELIYANIRGEDNPADGLTNHVRQELAEKYLVTTGVQLGKDRAKTSLRVAGDS